MNREENGNIKDGTSMKDQILDQIHADALRMRPKVYFTLQIAALVLLVLMILVISVFLSNFILFSIRINNHDALLGFGPRGIQAFLMFFPWPLLILDVALIILLEWLVRRFRFGYKSPLLFLFLGLILLIGAVGLIMDRGTPVNDILLRTSDERMLPPPFEDVYGHVRRAPLTDAGFCKCVISAIDGGILTVTEPHSSTTMTVLLPPDDYYATTSGLSVGDVILVAGDRDGMTIRAFGVRKIVPDDRVFFYIQRGSPVGPDQPMR